MNQKQLLEIMKSQVTREERIALNSSGEDLTISKYNRTSVLEMLEHQISHVKELDEMQVQGLENQLKKYLETYMQDKPEGHKWIILASMYHAFIKEIPLHPLEVIHPKILVRDGKTEYFCPAREEGDESVCRWCVCKKMEEENHV